MEKKIRKHFSRELEKIKKQILSLGTMVEERVRMALLAVETNDADMAQRIIKNDYEIDEMEVVNLGREIRYHTAFAPAGTNANFIARDGSNAISVRTYERGVEDETLACGTGIVACAVVAGLLNRVTPPVTVTPTSGDELVVDFDALDRSREAPSPTEHGPELSRSYRGLRLWLPLMLHGAGAFREELAEKSVLTGLEPLVDEQCRRRSHEEEDASTGRVETSIDGSGSERAERKT